MKNKYIWAFLVGIVCVFLLFPKLSFAISFESGGGVEGLGSFTGSWDYSFTDSENATLTVTLANTSDDGNGGFITAFAFNNPDDSITGVTLSSTDTDFGLIGDLSFDNSINAAPFGHFDIGATVDGSWIGGGDTVLGIDTVNPDDPETFTFTLTGTDLDLLTIGDFINELSVLPPGDSPQYLAVRFQSFENEGSDKVPAVPEPGTVLLLGSGLVGLALYGRKRFRKEAGKASLN